METLIKAERILGLKPTMQASEAAFVYSVLPSSSMSGRLFDDGYWTQGSPRPSSIAAKERLGPCLQAAVGADVIYEEGEKEAKGDAYPRFFNHRGHRLVGFSMLPPFKDFTVEEVILAFKQSKLLACHLCDNPRCGRHDHIVIAESKANSEHRWRDENMEWLKESPEAAARRARRIIANLRKVDAETAAKVKQLIRHWSPTLNKVKPISKLTGLPAETVKAVLDGSAKVFNPKMVGDQYILDLK